MKILFLYSYFKPEKTSGAHFAEDFRRALADAGHTMYVYAPTPTRGVSDEVRREYSKNRKIETELDGKLHIRRFSLFQEGKGTVGRALRYAVLELQLLWFGLRAPKVDLLWSGSTPPINGLMATLLKKIRRIPYVYVVQDLFPDSLVSSGIARRGSLLWKIGNRVSNITYRNAEHVLTISDSMKDALIARGVPSDKITVAYNWIDSESTHPVPREENPLFDELSLPRDGFYVTYAGNLGNSQNVGLLVECAKQFTEYPDVRFVIFGNGSEKDALERQIKESGLSNVYLFPMQPLERVPQVYSLGDMSVVLCKAGAGGGAFPSKAASIMACGTAIVTSFDEDSDLCRIVREHDVGLCAAPEDADALAQALRTGYTDRERCRRFGENGRELAKTFFSKEHGTRARLSVLERCAEN